MKRLFLLIAGWGTLAIGLFLGSLAGTVAEQFGVTRNGQLLIQGIVMSGLVVPVILYLYRHVYRYTGVKPKRPVYSWKRISHFFTGLLLSMALAFLGFVMAISQGWIVITQWHPSEYWLGALLINTVVAFLYEALPEELALRGLVYDVLRLRFVAWLSVLFQTLLFLSVPLAVTQLQVLVGLAPGNAVDISYIILILCFGVCLQLLRLWTRSLWASMGFHLGYLEITRFVVMADGYGAPPILTYHDSLEGLSGVFISFVAIVIDGIMVSLLLLGGKQFIRRIKPDDQQ